MDKATHLARLFALGVALTFSPAALAQESVAGTADPNYEYDDGGDDGFDLGWLGLLGLAGLAGLLKRPERHVVHQPDTSRTTASAR